jgi:hypothetical protein
MESQLVNQKTSNVSEIKNLQAMIDELNETNEKRDTE